MNSSLGIQLFSYPFRDPTTDVPLALGTVTTTLAGTATPVATFADAALGTPNSNPLTLSAGGYATMFFSPLNGGVAGVSYDVVVKNAAGATIWTFEDVAVPVPTAGGNASSAVVGLKAESLTIAGGAITPSGQVLLLTGEGGAADNLDTIAVTAIADGALLLLRNASGAAAITIRHGVDNLITADGGNVVLSATTQLVAFVRVGATVRQISVPTTQDLDNSVNNFRLSLASGTPVTTTNLVNQATLYWVPFTGNRISLYVGAVWVTRTSSQLSLALGTATTLSNFDVFAYDNNGVVALELGTAWTTLTSRALGLIRQDGVLVLASDPTRRYLGTIYTTDTGKTTDSSVAGRNVFNAANPVQRAISVSDPSAPWSYNTATYRLANANSSNAFFVTCGWVDRVVQIQVDGVAVCSDAGQVLSVAIGVDSTIVFSGRPIASTTSVANGVVRPSALYVELGTVGTIVYYWLERGSGTGTATWYGTSTAGPFAGSVRAGLSGWVWA